MLRGAIARICGCEISITPFQADVNAAYTLLNSISSVLPGEKTQQGIVELAIPQQWLT